MANLFDKTWDKLTTLQEAFVSNADVVAFYNIFVDEYVKQLQKAFPKVAWRITATPYDPNISVKIGSGGKTVSAKVDITVSTTKFDIQKDFDIQNPTLHNNKYTPNAWEEYLFLGDKAQITQDLWDYLTNFTKHGIDFTKLNADYNDVEVQVLNTNFTVRPSAYRYLTSSTIKVSRFTDTLQAVFTLQLSFFDLDTSIATTPGNEPRIEQTFLEHWGFTSSNIKYMQDENFTYDEIDLTEKYRNIVSKTVDKDEILKAIGIKLPETPSDILFELKINRLTYVDPTLYPADGDCKVPHYVTWVAKDKEQYTAAGLAYCASVVRNISFALPVTQRIPTEVIANSIEYFHIYIKNTANEITSIINNYIDGVIAGDALAERKLEDALDGVTWKGLVINKDNSVSLSIREKKEGVGYDDTIKDIINRKLHFKNFIIVSGEF